MITTIMNVLYNGALIASCVNPSADYVVCYSPEGERTIQNQSGFVDTLEYLEGMEPGYQVELFLQEVTIHEI
jgi:hypothetical protein